MSYFSELFSTIKTKLSPNYSSRYGSLPKACVIHTTEGSYEGTVQWFLNRDAAVSSHYVVDDKKSPSRWSDVTLMVPEGYSAWTAKSAMLTFIKFLATKD